MTNRQDKLDKGMIHVPGGAEQEGIMFHHITQDGGTAVETFSHVYSWGQNSSTSSKNFWVVYFQTFPSSISRLQLTTGN